MTTPMIGVFRAKNGRTDDLLDLVRQNLELLGSKGYLSDKPPTILSTRDGFIVAFEYSSGGAESAHSDQEVLDLWSRFDSLADSLGMHALPEGNATLPGTVSVS